MWEEYCEEFKEQYKGDDSEMDETGGAVGDVGENQPAYTENWPEYKSTDEKFKFQYPDKYKTVVDNYGWPHAVVHLLDKAGGQSYDVTFEVWDDENGPEAEGRNGPATVFFGMGENSNTGKYISMTCFNPDALGDCEDIYATLTFQMN
jgi:hypothetical protein